MDRPEGEWASMTTSERAAFIANLEDRMHDPGVVIDVRTGKTPFWATGAIASVAVRKGQPKRPRGRPPKPKPVDV